MNIRTFQIIASLIIILCCSPIAAQSDYVQAELERRIKTDSSFTDLENSPLNKDSIPNFSGLNYFEPDESYCLLVKVKKNTGPTFLMPTSSGALKEFRQYAILKFKLNGKKHKLPIYQNIRLMAIPHYKDYLFIPFTDLTNHIETYGGGRYIEARIPQKGELLKLDFNQCFNPYCHYSTGYNCPVPPKENFIDTRIEAGEKILYADH